MDVAIADTVVTAVSTRLGFANVDANTVATYGAYAYAGIQANPTLGPGRYLAGPVFGMAGAYTDMETSALVKSAGDPCDCKK